jgi:hypothetical protein
LAFDAFLEGVAEAVESDFEATDGAVYFAGVFFERSAFKIAMEDEVAILGAHFGEADLEGVVALVEVFGVLGEFFGEGGFEFVAEDEAFGIAGLLFAVVKDFEAGDGEGPGFEVGAEFEVGAFFPEGGVGLLGDVAGIGIAGHEGVDVEAEGHLVVGEEGDDLVVGAARIVGALSVRRHWVYPSINAVEVPEVNKMRGNSSRNGVNRSLSGVGLVIFLQADGHGIG